MIRIKKGRIDWFNRNKIKELENKIEEMEVIYRNSNYLKGQRDRMFSSLTKEKIKVEE